MEMLAANSGIIVFLVLGFGIFTAWGTGVNDVVNTMGTEAAAVQTVQSEGAVAIVLATSSYFLLNALIG